jgi:hypothetical protein
MYKSVRWAGHASRMEDVRNVYKSIVQKSEGKRHFGDLGVKGVY